MIKGRSASHLAILEIVVDSVLILREQLVGGVRPARLDGSGKGGGYAFVYNFETRITNGLQSASEWEHPKLRLGQGCHNAP